LRDGEVAIADAAAVAGDPALALRAAAAAASRRTRLERRSLDRLAAEAPAPPEPWDPATRSALVELLAAGPPAVPLLEALDQQGCGSATCPSGRACAAARSATPSTGTRSTATCGRPPPVPPPWPAGWPAPTCCWSAPCCTTSARGSRGTTPRRASS